MTVVGEVDLKLSVIEDVPIVPLAPGSRFPIQQLSKIHTQVTVH
jgi:hypothetical protein